MSQRERLVLEAQELQQKLQKIAARLEESYSAAVKIDLGQTSTQDLIVLESLSARFERAIDILLRAFFRVIDTLEGVEGGMIMDALARAEKRGIIESAEEFYELRLTRNRIAHEYLDVEALEMAQYVRSKTPVILEAIKRAAVYPIR